MKRLQTFAILMLAVFLVASCGVRPSQLEPPEGSDKKAYPRVYPNPATDPKPEPPPTMEQANEGYW